MTSITHAMTELSVWARADRTSPDWRKRQKRIGHYTRESVSRSFGTAIERASRGLYSPVHVTHPLHVDLYEENAKLAECIGYDCKFPAKLYYGSIITIQKREAWPFASTPVELPALPTRKRPASLLNTRCTAPEPSIRMASAAKKPCCGSKLHFCFCITVRWAKPSGYEL
jgi:hypothetical protein